MTIQYVKGDATQPLGSGPKVIMHICNNLGGWGSGFVLALSRKWPEPEASYRAWASSKDGSFKLGSIKLVEVTPNLFVANMVAQDGFPSFDRPVAVSYPALRKCLKALAEEAPVASIHAPRIGAGLGGGNWDTISKIIEEELQGISVTIYDFA